MSVPLVIWRFSDGKPGHLAQSQGLIDALARRCAVRVEEVPVDGAGFLARFAGRMMRRPASRALRPAPDLLIACGRRTHWPALRARWTAGGRLIVLMRPSFPVRWCDLCIIPEHDEPPQAEHVVTSRGALNTVRPTEAPINPRAPGLILVGGPSKHHGWDGATLTSRLVELLSHDAREWRLTTSRRTPKEFLTHLHSVLTSLPPEVRARMTIVPGDQTPRGWVAGQLACCSSVWVTEDSVSMIYESLTAGRPVGVLPAPRRGEGRVTRGLDRLLAEGWVASFDEFLRSGAPPAPRGVLAEADRCAGIVLARQRPNGSSARDAA